MKPESHYKIQSSPTSALQEPVARHTADEYPRPAKSTNHSWDAWFDGKSVTADFMIDRDQPPDDAR